MKLTPAQQRALTRALAGPSTRNQESGVYVHRISPAVRASVVEALLQRGYIEVDCVMGSGDLAQTHYRLSGLGVDTAHELRAQAAEGA